MKLRLWKSRVKQQNFVHFPNLLKCNVSESQKYVRITSELREASDTRFQDFKNSTFSYNLFSSPFAFSTDKAPVDLQVHCADFHCAPYLKVRSITLCWTFIRITSRTKSIPEEFSWLRYLAAHTSASTCRPARSYCQSIIYWVCFVVLLRPVCKTLGVLPVRSAKARADIFLLRAK